MKNKNHMMLYITLVDIIFLLGYLFSYYLKKMTGYVLYNFAALFYFGVFIEYVIITSAISIGCRRFFLLLIQISASGLMFLMWELDLPDRLALLIEVPRIERRIEKLTGEELADTAIEVSDDFIVLAWEPGFLDYQWVLALDRKNIFGDGYEDEKIWIPEGRIYPIFKGMDGWYLCVLYR